MILADAFARVKKANPPADQLILSHKFDLPDALNNVRDAVVGEPGEDKFYNEELAVAALLLWRFQSIVEAKGLVEMILSAADTDSPKEVTEALNDATAELSQVIDTESKREELLALLMLTAGTGAAILGLNNLIQNSRTANKIITQYGQTAAWYANNYFRRIVRPKLENTVQDEMNALRRESLRKALEAQVQGGLMDSDIYWRLTGNQATGRAHHYGILRASQDRGIYAYKLVAVRDKRTSALCRNLDGRMFYVNQGIDLLERLAATPPESAGSVAPWVKLSDVEDLDDDKLAAMGVLVPPFHSHCRTTLRPLYN